MIATAAEALRAEATEDAARPGIEGDWPTPGELFPELDWDDHDAWVDAEIPDAKLVTASIMQALKQVEARHDAVAKFLDGFTTCFEGCEEDIEVEKRCALAELSGAAELLREVRRGLASWFRCVNLTRLIQLGADTWDALKRIGQASMPIYRRHQYAELITRAAILRLAGDADAGEAIAQVERDRLEALHIKHDGDSWPYKRARCDGRPVAGKPNSAPCDESKARPAPDELIGTIVTCLRGCSRDFLRGVLDGLADCARRHPGSLAGAGGASAVLCDDSADQGD